MLELSLTPKYSGLLYRVEGGQIIWGRKQHHTTALAGQQPESTHIMRPIIAIMPTAIQKYFDTFDIWGPVALPENALWRQLREWMGMPWFYCRYKQHKGAVMHT